LTEAFDALGGRSWNPSHIVVREDAEDELMLQNQFSALSLGAAVDEDDGVVSEDDAHPKPAKQQKKKTGKGKRGKKPKRKQALESTAQSSLTDVPIESYRIIEDDRLVTEYLLAVYAVAEEWVSLRCTIQDLWREVFHDGLHGTVAASLTNIAVAMVKQTCMAVFAEFPGHEPYDTIIQTITRGDQDKAQADFRQTFCWIQGPLPENLDTIETMDAKEHFFLHVYNDLMTFLTDFQKNRTGTPTKAMQAQLNKWNPTFDLQRATYEKRIKWRRDYIIKWLYDLVNVYSSIVAERKELGYHEQPKLFGLDEFAREISAIAMRKPSTDIRGKILPHHVFQLQCIVDSFTASRGWTHDLLRGHILVPPPRNFRALRDLDLFLDRKQQTKDHGLLKAFQTLNGCLQRDAALHPDPVRVTMGMILEQLDYDFFFWLGKSRCMVDDDTTQISQFSKHNVNGLWEYSPLLCAAGMVEALISIQRIMMFFWDNMPEPILILHLHNMIVKKSYLKEPLEIYLALEEFLKDSFFPVGVPTDKFHDALANQLLEKKPMNSASIRQTAALARNRTSSLHQVFDLNNNRFFKTKLALMMYHEVGWLPEQIPDSTVMIPSFLYHHRLMQTEQMIDRATGEKRLKETELVKRAKAQGESDAALLELASVAVPEALIHPVLSLEKDGKAARSNHVAEQQVHGQLSGYLLLEGLRIDMFHDVRGSLPLSTLHYVWITIHMMVLWTEVEHRLQETRNPLWVNTYEKPMAHPKRVKLVLAAMLGEQDGHEQVLRIFADVFDGMRMPDHDIFINMDDQWTDETGHKSDEAMDQNLAEGCTVM
jgi:hypothetical protein